MRLFARTACCIFATACLCIAPRGEAINIVLDYRYDSVAEGGSNFFGAGNPSGAASGAQAKAALEAAAGFFSTVITDTLDAIPFTDPNTPGGQNTPVWRQTITHPGTNQAGYAISSAADAAQDGLTPFQGAANEFRDIQIAADEFLVYAGGSSVSSAGVGGTGVGFFGSTAFNDSIDQRGEAAGEYSTWGGYVTFDKTNSWHYDHTVAPGSGTDFFSVALHELGHALGLNTSGTEWQAHVSGSEFQGPSALAKYQAEDPSGAGATGIPLESAGNPHYKNNVPSTGPPSVQSFIVGTTTLQEVAMDPSILNGTRKSFTNVDTFALEDIGWTVDVSGIGGPTLLLGDADNSGTVTADDLIAVQQNFGNSGPNNDGTDLGDANDDGTVTADDLISVQQNFGNSLGGAGSAVPEPASLALILVGCAAVATRRI